MAVRGKELKVVVVNPLMKILRINYLSGFNRGDPKASESQES